MRRLAFGEVSWGKKSKLEEQTVVEDKVLADQPSVGIDISERRKSQKLK
jgi:hypothetical protein